METLNCPVCGMEMEYKLNPRIDIGTSFIRENHKYSCENGHEKVSVILNEDASWNYVTLGDGVYLVNEFNVSCEKAINRMRKEYEDWE